MNLIYKPHPHAEIRVRIVEGFIYQSYWLNGAILASGRHLRVQLIPTGNLTHPVEYRTATFNITFFHCFIVNLPHLTASPRRETAAIWK
jgi:hypothetical protein